jgi:amino acid transporter
MHKKKTLFNNMVYAVAVPKIWAAMKKFKLYLRYHLRVNHPTRQQYKNLYNMDSLCYLVENSFCEMLLLLTISLLGASNSILNFWWENKMNSFALVVVYICLCNVFVITLRHWPYLTPCDPLIQLMELNALSISHSWALSFSCKLVFIPGMTKVGRKLLEKLVI